MFSNKSKTMHGFTLTPDIQGSLYNLWFNHKIIKHKDLDEYDVKTIRDNISGAFDELDKEKVPFSIQNKILELSEKGESFEDFIDALKAA